MTDDDITCGCPDSCNSDALSENNGSPFSCRKRIEWLMQKDKKSEGDACALSSESPDNIEQVNVNRPCRFDACHPKGCGSTLEYEETTTENYGTTTGGGAGDDNNNNNNNNNNNKGGDADTNDVDSIEEFDDELVTTCGCPDTCTPAVIEQTRQGMDFNCIVRIELYRHHWKMDQYTACMATTEEGFCDYAACNPVACGSTLSPPPPVVKTGRFWLTVFMIGGLGFLAVWYYRNFRGVRRRRAVPTSPPADGVFRDKIGSDVSQDVELTAAMSYKYNSRSRGKKNTQQETQENPSNDGDNDLSPNDG